MIHTQKEQQLRTRVERDLKSGRIAEGLDAMSQHQRRDFPPGWEPPPRIGFVEEPPHILDVMDVLAARETTPWVRAEFVDKFRRYLGENSIGYRPTRGVDFRRIVRILQHIPEGPAIASSYREDIENQLSDQELPAEDRASIEALLKLARAAEPGR
jgi:hypothetical protein